MVRYKISQWTGEADGETSLGPLRLRCEAFVESLLAAEEES